MASIDIAAILEVAAIPTYHWNELGESKWGGNNIFSHILLFFATHSYERARQFFLSFLYLLF